MMGIDSIFDKNKVILAIGPHPDDIEYSAGALIQARHGENIVLLYVTRGGNGRQGHETIYKRDIALEEERERESRQALQILGIQESPEFLNYPDQGTYLHISEIEKSILGVIEYARPDIVLIPSWEGAHPDHDITHYAAVRATQRYKGLHKADMQIFEYAGYNNYGNMNRHKEFIPPEESIAVHHEDIAAWYQAMQEFRSQWHSLQDFVDEPLKLGQGMVADRFRYLPQHDYHGRPHSGKLYYETWGCTVRPELVIQAIEQHAKEGYKREYTIP